MAIIACKDVIICDSWRLEFPGQMNNLNAGSESLDLNPDRAVIQPIWGADAIC